jgi:hypothetical protein
MWVFRLLCMRGALWTTAVPAEHSGPRRTIQDLHRSQDRQHHGTQDVHIDKGNALKNLQVSCNKPGPQGRTIAQAE